MFSNTNKVTSYHNNDSGTGTIGNIRYLSFGKMSETNTGYHNSAYGISNDGSLGLLIGN